VASIFAVLVERGGGGGGKCFGIKELARLCERDNKRETAWPGERDNKRETVWPGESLVLFHTNFLFLSLFAACFFSPLPFLITPSLK